MKRLAIVTVLVIVVLLLSPALASAKAPVLTASISATTPWQAGTEGSVTVYTSTSHKGKVTIKEIASDCGLVVDTTTSFSSKKHENQAHIHTLILAPEAPTGICQLTTTVTFKQSGKKLVTQNIYTLFEVTPAAKQYPTITWTSQDATPGGVAEVVITITNETSGSVDVSGTIVAYKSASILKNPNLIAPFPTVWGCYTGECSWYFNSQVPAMPLHVGQSHQFIIRWTVPSAAPTGSFDAGYITLQEGDQKVYFWVGIYR